VNALCTSFGLRPRRIARSWIARLSACIVAMALILAGSPAVAMPEIAHADATASARSAHCGPVSAEAHAVHSHDAAHSHDAVHSGDGMHSRTGAHPCCTSVCACVHACAPAPIVEAGSRFEAAGQAFRCAIASTPAAIDAPLLRPPIL
jgi:hypothetical protein